MNYPEYYAERASQIEAQIFRNRKTAALIFSESWIARRRAEKALKRLQRLNSQLVALHMIEAEEALQSV